MSNDLAPVWNQVGWYLDNNISIIPVRDTDENINGKFYAKKTPYAKWEKYQTEIISRADLFELMNAKNTTAIAMVCGRISGNLVVIDIDTKYYPGIDVIIFTAIKELYPELLKVLRVHKSPSGGAHIIYRINDATKVPRSHNIANRYATPEELLIDPKRTKRCFVEIKAEGGLCTAPPSMGYIIRQDVPIPVITYEDHESIYGLCKSLDEIIPDEKPYKPPAAEVDYYDENPFAHYNRTVDPTELLTTYGWTHVRRAGNYIWYTKPGGKKNDVHGSYVIDKGVYRIFSTDTGLDDKFYLPASILAFYGFNNDKAATYHHLVNNGYGRIKPHVEQRIARRNAIQQTPMPANASPQAVEQYNAHVENITANHPHGIFWQLNEKNEVTVSRLGFKDVAHGLGFRLHKNELVQIIEKFIYKRDERCFFDCMRDYIHEDDADLYEDIYNATQGFLQKNGGFELSQLEQLDQTKILNDTKQTCYKFYKNGFVFINSNEYTIKQYEELNNLVWHEKIQQRDFVYNTNATGLYSNFLQLACDTAKNNDHIMSVIGFLAHDYKDTSMAYIVVLTEQCADPKDGGGSGKNLFCELLQYTTTYGSTAIGQKRNFDGTTLLQAWHGEKVYALSDVKKDFDFESLKEAAGGKALHKKLFKDEKNMDVKDVPKLIVLTNFSFDITDGGLKRRIVAVEFTNFFTLCGGVDKHFGKMFADDWCENDWVDYDNFICKSIMHWLNNNCKLKSIELSETGWEKQFSQNYGVIIHEFIKENWPEFKQGNFISNADFNKKLDEFMVENNYNITKFKPTKHKINNALDEWCKKHNYAWQNEVERLNLVQIERGRKFYENAPF